MLRCNKIIMWALPVLGTALMSMGSAQAEEDRAISEVEGPLSVMVLGSGGPMATASGRASAGYLVFVEGQPRILMDVGGGTYARIAESGVNLKDLDIVLLSHLHVDHTADLSAVLKTVYFHNRSANVKFPPGRTAPVRVFGPGANGVPFPAAVNPDATVAQYPGSSEYIADHYDVNRGVERYLNVFTRAISGGIFKYETTDVAPNFKAYNPTTIYDTDGLTIKAVGVNHGPVPALAFRIEYKGRSIVYSGDTSSVGGNMPALANAADLLIYDTAIMDDAPAGPNDAIFFALHTTPTRLGQVAAMANPRKVVLSHLTPITEPHLDEVKALIQAQGYSGRISVAHDLKVYNLEAH